MIKCILEKYIYWVGAWYVEVRRELVGVSSFSVWALGDGLKPLGLLESDLQYLLSLFKFF